MKPVVDRLTKEYDGKVDFRRIDPEKDKSGAELMDQFGALYVPTFVFINTDGSKADMKVGELKEEDLRKAIDALK